MCGKATRTYDEQIKEAVDHVVDTAAEEGLELIDILKKLAERL